MLYKKVHSILNYKGLQITKDEIEKSMKFAKLSDTDISNFR